MSTIRKHSTSRLHIVGLALAVAVLVYVNWDLWASPVDTSPLVGVAQASEVGSSAPGEAVLFETPAAGSLPETTARPVFLATRRPIPPKIAEAPAAEPAALPVTTTPPDQLQLVGVVRLGKGLEKALIRSSGELSGHWIPVGEMVQGWQISAIDLDKAVIETNGQRVELRLAYGGPAGDEKQLSSIGR